jgi:hypothetical protein
MRDVEYTDDFEVWWDQLDADEQESIAACVELLRQLGPNLPRPHADTLKGSRHSNMKELRDRFDGSEFP